MPSASEFKKAYELYNGKQIGSGCEIVSARIGHNSVQQHERYSFPSTVTVRVGANGCNRRQLLAAFTHYTSNHCIVSSAYGTPYECSVGRPKVEKIDLDDRLATISFVGHAVRRHDLLTTAQQRRKLHPHEVDRAGMFFILTDLVDLSKPRANFDQAKSFVTFTDNDY
jgi:hypothetical protein